MKAEKNIIQKLQALSHARIPDVWDEIKDVPLGNTAGATAKPRKRTLNRFVPIFAGSAACLVAVFGVMFMNNAPNSSDFIGSVETPKNTSAVTDTALDATENPSRTDNQPAVTNDVPDTNTPVVVVTETSVTNQPVVTEAPVTNTPAATEAPVVAAPIVINSRMAGTRTDVTREEWERAFALSFSLPETLSNTMVVQYSLIRDGNRLLGGNISISDGLDEAVKWMSATVRPVSPETNPFAMAGADVILDGTVIPRSEMSVIGETETLIASSVCEFFGRRSYGVFNSRSFQVTFESVEFTDNMVRDFVRAFG